MNITVTPTFERGIRFGMKPYTAKVSFPNGQASSFYGNTEEEALTNAQNWLKEEAERKANIQQAEIDERACVNCGKLECVCIPEPVDFKPLIQKVAVLLLVCAGVSYLAGAVSVLAAVGGGQ